MKKLREVGGAGKDIMDGTLWRGAIQLTRADEGPAVILS